MAFSVTLGASSARAQFVVTYWTLPPPGVKWTDFHVQYVVPNAPENPDWDRCAAWAVGGSIGNPPDAGALVAHGATSGGISYLDYVWGYLEGERRDALLQITSSAPPTNVRAYYTINNVPIGRLTPMTPTTPEPGTIGFLVLGGLGLFGRRMLSHLPRG